MIKSNKFRTMMTIFLGALFVASAFISNFNNAQMQTGANTIVFDRYDAELGQTKIFVMNADGTNVTELGNGYSPSWSGNGAKIAYADGDSEQFDIWTMNADGSEKAQLTENFRSFAPAWSPDGSRIAFVSDHEGGYHVYTINADGSNQQRLTVTAAEVFAEYAPAWSPDSSKIIFIGHKIVDGLGRHDFYAANADNIGTTTQLTSLNALLEYVPATVSPDASRIVFRNQFALRAISTDGSNQLTQLTDNSTDKEPDYAPGGSKIIFRRGNYLTVMNADGSNITSLDVVGRNPDWNPSAVIQSPTPTPTATPTATPTPTNNGNVGVQVSASSQNVFVNQEVTLTANVFNYGSVPSTNVILSDTLAQNLSFVSAQTTQGNCTLNTNVVWCEFGTLNAQTGITVTIVVKPTSVGAFNNHFVVTANAAEPDPDWSNNIVNLSINASAAPCAQPFNLPYAVVREQWRRDERNAQDELFLTIKNITNQNLEPRMIFVIDGLPSGITVDQSVVAGYTQCAAPLGNPYVVAYAPNKREWKPSQTITFRILFNNPSRGGIPHTYRLYNGNANP